MVSKRMLHTKISKSLDVNKLDLEAQLLFTWLISHADDEGRLRGEPEYVKAAVVPMKLWSFEDISKYLIQMQNLGLIHYWEKDDIKIIEFTKWKDHQSIRADRFTPSSLPPYDNQPATSSLPTDNQTAAQANTSEENKKEVKKSEVKSFADKSFNSSLDPDTYKDKIDNEDEYAAYEAWKKLEPNNKAAFYTTYLWAVKSKGLNADTIYRIVSEIQQDKTIKNTGSIFRVKVINSVK